MLITGFSASLYSVPFKPHNHRWGGITPISQMNEWRPGRAGEQSKVMDSSKAGIKPPHSSLKHLVQTAVSTPHALDTCQVPIMLAPRKIYPLPSESTEGLAFIFQRWGRLSLSHPLSLFLLVPPMLIATLIGKVRRVESLSGAKPISVVKLFLQSQAAWV